MNRNTHVFVALAAAGLVLSGGAVDASAQGWQRGPFRYERGPHTFGPRCEYRIVAHGRAPLGLFGGRGGAARAERRAIRDWEEDARRLFGPRYSSWEHASGKDLSCRIVGLRFDCRASAHPCRLGRGGPGRDGRRRDGR